MKLVDNWKDCWKWLSVHAMVGCAAVQGAWVYIPADMKSSIPSAYVNGLTMCLLALGIAGRLLKQDKEEKHELPSDPS